MNDTGILDQPAPIRQDHRRNRSDQGASASATLELTRMGCLDLLSLAFTDLAERDDIHQAAHRLQLVLGWIDGEVARAAGNAIFSDTAACPDRRSGGAVRSSDTRRIYRRR